MWSFEFDKWTTNFTRPGNILKQIKAFQYKRGSELDLI